MNNWVKVKDFETSYEVSDHGQVRSIGRLVNDNGGLRKANPKSINGEIIGGYHRVCLSRNSRKSKYLVHRLVAINFLPNPENLPCVNHKDGNKLNNTVENLEWCTQAHNIQHAYNTGLKVGISKPGQLNEQSVKSKPVIQLSKDGCFIKLFPCTQEVQRQLGFHRTNIGACANGKLKSAYGYKWQYK